MGKLKGTGYHNVPFLQFRFRVLGGPGWEPPTTSSMLKATGGSISIYTRTIAASFRFGDKPCDTEKVLQCLAQALTDILLIIFHPR